MKNWLARLFGVASEAQNPQAAQAETPAPAGMNTPAPATMAAPQGSPQMAAASNVQVDAAFYRWLSGASGDEQASPNEARAQNQILDELTRLAASPDAGANLVPRVPAVIPELLRSLRDDSITGSDLARQLAQDVVLVAEVIREANSPYYRPSAPIKTIEGAVMLLGQNGLRMLLARVSFRPIINMQGGQFSRQLAPQIWSQSEKCALAASMLAPGMGANPFEAYLAALMENVGLMVALRLIDLMNTDPVLPRSGEFSAALYARARILSSRIGALWDFPATVTQAIEQCGDAPTTALARTLALSDRISKLRMLIDTGQLASDDPFVVAGLDGAALACLTNLRNEDKED